MCFLIARCYRNNVRWNIILSHKDFTMAAYASLYFIWHCALKLSFPRKKRCISFKSSRVFLTIRLDFSDVTADLILVENHCHALQNTGLMQYFPFHFNPFCSLFFHNYVVFCIFNEAFYGRDAR